MPDERATLRDAWEAQARNWLAWSRTPDHDSYWHFHRDAFLAGLPDPPLRVVDVGCGEGRLTRDLKALGYDVVGVDASPTLSQAAREADPDGEYQLADAAALPLADASADLVVAFMSPQDLDDLDGAVREAARALVPGVRLRLARGRSLATGLLIDHVAEPPDTSRPPGDRWRRVPLFLHLGAVKPNA